MFEIDDPKLGKIKFINITEARAQIAAITQDKECSYVLTKNNKPIRVIVNYDLFHQWQQQEVSRTDSKPFDKSILQGLLEGREQDLKKTVVSKLQELGYLIDNAFTDNSQTFAGVVYDAYIQAIGKGEGLLFKAFISDSLL